MKRKICEYCGKDAELVTGRRMYPHRFDLHKKKFWLCKPCNAYVGCHKMNIAEGIYDDYQPLGRLANSELRKAKQDAHKAFDPYWKEDNRRRKDCYEELAVKMGVEINECHIGEFNISQCRRVVSLCNSGLF